mgnify:CR=1 FL=1
MSAIEQTPEGLRLKIILQPKASKDQIVGLHDDELKITISAPPVDLSLIHISEPTRPY